MPHAVLQHAARTGQAGERERLRQEQDAGEVRGPQVRALVEHIDGLIEEGRLPEAEAAAKAAIAKAAATSGAGSLPVGVGHIYLAKTYQRMSRHGEAEKVARQALSMLEATAGPDATPTNGARLVLGSALISLSRFKEAEGYLERGLQSAGSNAVQTISALHSLSRLRTEQGRLAEAEKLALRALPIAEKSQGRDSEWTVSVLHRLAYISYSAYWKGGSIDYTLLANGLPPLPETVEELEKVATTLGARREDIYLGKAATESAVKAANLGPYRVVYFATHGLIAGDVQGLGEPALALATPATPTEADDGLLTASEVARLKLNADWVVLSACNTAAGDKSGAEAFSGLARSFFYAGARAILVSHWPVDSVAAVALTTKAFDALQQQPGLGRAEALRRSMLAYMNDTSDPLNAHPAFWGPFAVVGEGGT
jgi:tetratricopeptide (TPR) repeat protein